MVLNDIADASHFIIKATTPAHAEILGHCDLHIFDVVPVPNRLQKAIGKAEIEKVLQRLLAEKMVDAE